MSSVGSLIEHPTIHLYVHYAIGIKFSTYLIVSKTPGISNRKQESSKYAGREGFRAVGFTHADPLSHLAFS